MKYLLILILTTVTFAAKKPFTIESFLAELSAKGPAKHERLIKKQQENLQQLSASDTYTLINALADSGWGETISHCKTYLIPIDAFSVEEKTALQKAFLTGEYEKAKLLLEIGCDPTIRLKKENDGDGLLYHAIQAQKFDLFKALIDAGVNPNTTAGEGVDYRKREVSWADSSSNLWTKKATFLEYLLNKTTYITEVPTPLVERLIKKFNGNSWNSQLFLLIKHDIIKDKTPIINLHRRYLLRLFGFGSSTKLDLLLSYPKVLKINNYEDSPLLNHLLEKRSIHLEAELFATYLDSINCSYETFNKEGKNYLVEIFNQENLSKKHKLAILKRIKPEKLDHYYSEIITHAASYAQSENANNTPFSTYTASIEAGLAVSLKPNFNTLPHNEDPLLYFLSHSIRLYPENKKGYTRFLELLLKCVDELNAQDNQGRTPLMWAQLLPKGNPLEKMLLNAGAKELDEEYWGE